VTRDWGSPDARPSSGSVNELQPEHSPVLVEPLVFWMDPRPGQVILDGTLGLGGHASVLIPRIMPGGRYIGLDLDEAMLAGAQSNLAGLLGANVELVQANYAEFPEVLKAQELQRVDQLFLDLGVNSAQLSDPSRGFSFERDGNLAQLSDPSRGFSFERDGNLDMRYDRGQARQAVDLVNALSENDLADLFYQFGQEGMSRKIARRICQVRHNGRIMTTGALARAVESAYTAAGAGRSGRIHPATRVFQALRVAVNRELDNLKLFLSHVLDFLSPGGKLAVISFHSLEDGMVKRFLRGARDDFEELTDRPVVADEAERRANPRSRSAKLRVARRLGATQP
jgi:16S rRNA (cytosine1402-N4)-methyltransferase